MLCPEKQFAWKIVLQILKKLPSPGTDEQTPQFANSLKEDGNEWNANNEQVEKVECRAAERPLVKHEAVRDEF